MSEFPLLVRGTSGYKSKLSDIRHLTTVLNSKEVTLALESGKHGLDTPPSWVTRYIILNCKMGLPLAGRGLF